MAKVAAVKPKIDHGWAVYDDDTGERMTAPVCLRKYAVEDRENYGLPENASYTVRRVTITPAK